MLTYTAVSLFFFSSKYKRILDNKPATLVTLVVLILAVISLTVVCMIKVLDSDSTSTSEGVRVYILFVLYHSVL